MEVRSIKVTEFNEVGLLLRDCFTETRQGYRGEADILKKIRAEKTYNPAFELVAVEAEQVLGHVLLGEVSIDGVTGIALGPFAIRPGLQDKGVGTALLQEAEKRAGDQGYAFISILGSPEYYGTAGYAPAAEFGISASFETEKEAFLIRELESGALENVTGTLRYTSTM